MKLAQARQAHATSSSWLLLSRRPRGCPGARRPGTWKVMAVRFRYGEGALREIVSPKKDCERAALVITPSRCAPRPTAPTPVKAKAEEAEG